MYAVVFGLDLFVAYRKLDINWSSTTSQKQVLIVREPAASFQRKEQEELQLKTRNPTVLKISMEDRLED
ncbi:hypothetical protein pipiens_018426 [Culex pipiens pipiens]|uniref:Uncharacterized protein n=1 Tax=Culex pipiens pipiens TaxID=38569 RepID=A0ABD1CBS2_CULPP